MRADSVVMITGCGSGLGRALCRAFVEAGCRVVGIGHREDTVRETERLVASDRFVALIADVSDYGAVEGAVADAIGRFGRIDVLFNNAAVYPRTSFLEETADDWSRAIAVNVNGVANGCKAVLPHMIAAGFGRIYNLGSFADISPIPNSAAYSASKGAIHALTKAIAQDLDGVDADIEVHEWIPGHLNTRMSEFTGIDPAVSAGWAVQIAAIPHASRRSCLYENDHEWVPPRGIRQRLKDALLFWRRG